MEKRTTDVGSTYYLVRWRTPDGRQKSKSFAAFKDARSFRATIETRPDALTQAVTAEVGAPIHRFAAYVAHVLDGDVHLRTSTRARNVSALTNYIEGSTLGDLPLSAIAASDVDRWIGTVATGTSPASTRRAFQVVGKALRHAVRSGAIAANPAAGARLPAREYREMRTLTPAEVDQLANAAKAVSFVEGSRLLILVLAYVGCRWGEAVALRHSDLREGRITIARQLSEVAGKLEFTAPKTATGRRVVTAPAFLVTALEALNSELEPRPGDLLFFDTAGRPLRRSNWRRRVFVPAKKLAGIDPTFRLHDLRHTSATWMLERGLSPKVVAERLGHASVSTTLDTYAHVVGSLEADAAAVLNELNVTL